MATHLYDSKTWEQMPEYLKRQNMTDGYWPAKCGYMRRDVVFKESKITCKSCLKKMNQSNK